MQAQHKSQTKITEFEPGNPLHRERFAALNQEWLNRYFAVEPQDEVLFADPEGKVLAKGGVILFASQGGEIVGTGSLLAMEKGVYELARMAVTDACQAQGIGARITEALLECARAKKARKLFIVSNTRLENALRLYRRYGFKDSSENRHHHYARGNITLEMTL